MIPASQILSICGFSLFYIMVNLISLAFGQLVRENKQIKDVALDTNLFNEKLQLWCRPGSIFLKRSM